MVRARFQGKILGETYTFTSEESQSQMKAVLELANQQLAAIKAANPNLSNEQAAILLAFNALSDQLKMQAAKVKD
ncbi:cell-division Z-ring component, stimulator of FtsZ polymerization [Weissella oryzae SG25]|uniref:Cell-division Z-ring component, stimulator of FtsZ polymerization n=1 Tax=Weissella oryzae (strain DSM 25784 / JCM 18191 / LMG 30913 / SG25) TaxID=1329250 RepID=A0A069D1Q9_WEIOS|nr:cell division protein ZapA [Weissella oryzae]GAK31266.1 cell-division Z-ring component, stimulator of FtsZ polymerization [Weissella oryzae SG25]